MERKMYKEKRQMEDAEAKSLFAKGHHGTLAVNGDDGYPYAVPVNYVYINGSIYIHSAKYGYKMEMIEQSKKVCFSTILDSRIIPNKFTAAFDSIIAFGDISHVNDDEEKRLVLEEFVNRFAPEYVETGMRFIDACWDKTAVLKIDVKELKGKKYHDGSWNGKVD